MLYKYDFLIIGAGVAGMSYALKVARAKKGKVCMICKTSLDEANTSFAQGGVASVTNMKLDTFDKHIADTIIAGDYISDRKAFVADSEPAAITRLSITASFDEIFFFSFMFSFLSLIFSRITEANVSLR